jgi:hypothetical protein
LAIARLAPDGLTPDLVDGTAWVSVTPFAVERFRVLAAPPLPGLSSFPETNVRTYVRTDDGRDGLWFFSIDVARASNTLGGRMPDVPYFPAAMSVCGTETARYRSRVSSVVPPATTSSSGPVLP